MTEKKRKQHSAEYKFKIALEAAKENKTLSQLASEQAVGYPLGANQISQWKRQLVEEGASLFKRNGKGEKASKEAEGAELYEQIGRGALWAQDGTGVTQGVPEKKVTRSS